MNMSPRYTSTAIALHWLIALLIFTGWSLGTYMTDLRLSPEKLRLYSWHKWIGITVLLLACVRASWRATHAPPPVDLAHPRWQRIAAALTHRSLYVLLFVLPLTGWMFSSASGYPVKYFGVIPLPDLVSKDKALAETLEAVHGTLAFVLALIVLLHVGAALKHHLFDRDDTLARMLPWARRRGRSPAP
jgi:cytochrome b561